MAIKITAPETADIEAPDAEHEKAVEATAAQQAEVDRLASEANTVALKIEELRARSDAALPDALDGKTKEYDKAEGERAEAEKRLAMVQRAREIATGKLADLRSQQSVAVRAGTVKALKKLFSARQAAFAELQTKLEEADAVWKELVAKSHQIAVLWPLPNQPAGGLALGEFLTRERELEVAVQTEMVRIGGGKPSPLPGAVTTDYRFIDRPAAIPPLAARLAQNDEYLMGLLTGDARFVTPPRPVAVPQAGRAPAASPEAPKTIRADAIPRKTVRLS